MIDAEMLSVVSGRGAGGAIRAAGGACCLSGAWCKTNAELAILHFRLLFVMAKILFDSWRFEAEREKAY